VEILFRTHTDASRDVHHLYPAGMLMTGYGRPPISGQGLCQAFLGVLSASSEAGGEKESLIFGCG
jgi:hypothetical protein